MSLRRTCPLVSPSALPALLALALLGAAAHAQDGAAPEAALPAVSMDPAIEADPLASATIDPVVFSTLLPNTNVTRRALVDSAVAAVLATPQDPRSKRIVPATPAPVFSPLLKPIKLDSGVAASTPSVLQLDNGQVVQLHADGLPGPNAPDRDPLVRVLPRAVNPNDVKIGARWGAEDRIEAPILSQIAWDAHADLLAGAAPPRAGAVRRSLRITALWDTPQDLAFGITPGFERGGGTFFEHYVAGLQASTLDKTKTARWRSFVEVSGEKISPNNLIDNSTANVHAGASYNTSASTQLDVSVTRGTTAVSDFQSSVGLSVRF